jgi:hypothetical protein
MDEETRRAILNPFRLKASGAVLAIVRDLRDRRGLKHEWDQIDHDIQQEIIDTWTDIVQSVLEAGTQISPATGS